MSTTSKKMWDIQSKITALRITIQFLEAKKGNHAEEIARIKALIAKLT